MKALVLGHKGQVGSALSALLRTRGHEVTDIDLPYDLRSYQPTLVDYMRESDVVYFLAFDVGGSKYLAKHQDSIEFLNNNVNIMRNVFTAASIAEANVIFASSQMSNMMWSQYGVLKRLGEFYTKSIGGINVRFWNVYGNESDPEKFHVVTDFINAALAGGPINMRTDGKEKRQMLHALDAAEALEILGNRFDSLDKDEYYDITSFEWTEIRYIADLIGHMFSVEVVPGEATDDVQRDTGNEPTTKILEYWTPEIDLSNGIRLVFEDITRWNQ